MLWLGCGAWIRAEGLAANASWVPSLAAIKVFGGRGGRSWQLRDANSPTMGAIGPVAGARAKANEGTNGAEVVPRRMACHDESRYGTVQEERWWGWGTRLIKTQSAFW